MPAHHSGRQPDVHLLPPSLCRSIPSARKWQLTTLWLAAVLLVGPALAAPAASKAFNLDVCNKHESVDDKPNMLLKVAKVRQSLPLLHSQHLPSCTASTCPGCTASDAGRLAHAVTLPPHPHPQVHMHVYTHSPLPNPAHMQLQGQGGSSMCTLYTRQISANATNSCSLSASDPSLVLRFPCKAVASSAEGARPLSGPSLNLWARITGSCCWPVALALHGAAAARLLSCCQRMAHCAACNPPPSILSVLGIYTH